MKNRLVLKPIGWFLVISLALVLTGCGGGGGGSTNPVSSGTDYAPDAVTAPNTTILANPAVMYNYATTAKNTAIEIPVNSEQVRFALTVSNVSGSAQTVRLMPESYVLGNVVTPVRTNNLVIDNSTLSGRYQNQKAFESKMRADYRLNATKKIPGLQKSIRASDHSAEVVGSVVPLSIVADQFGVSYVTKNCKLERLTAHCKIFVDQESHFGLSAISGTSAISSADLDHFASEFETHIWPLITQNYSPTYDIDNDGRVSIVFSPVYSKIGFAGLFNTNNLTTNANSNQRDMIAIFSPDPDNNWVGDRWKEASRETICHEMQHLANHSAHYFFNNVNQMEHEWLDEGMSVSSEARYRMLRGSSATENRFTLWAGSPSSFGLTSFSRNLSEYGQVGLFGLYLYEQGGAASIKNIVNASVLGTSNINANFASRGGMNGIYRDWAMAVLVDGLKQRGYISNLAAIDSKYKYSATLNLPLSFTEVSYGYSTSQITLPAYSSAFYVIRQNAGSSFTSYRFRVESTQGSNIELLMMRVP